MDDVVLFPVRYCSRATTNWVLPAYCRQQRRIHSTWMRAQAPQMRCWFAARISASCLGR